MPTFTVTFTVRGRPEMGAFSSYVDAPTRAGAERRAWRECVEDLPIKLMRVRESESGTGVLKLHGHVNDLRPKSPRARKETPLAKRRRAFKAERELCEKIEREPEVFEPGSAGAAIERARADLIAESVALIALEVDYSGAIHHTAEAGGMARTDIIRQRVINAASEVVRAEMNDRGLWEACEWRDLCTRIAASITCGNVPNVMQLIAECSR